MKDEIKKAQILVDAIPYMQQFNGKIVVIKYGGSAMVDEKLKESIIKDIVLLKLVGLKPVIVHGGGKDISDWISKVGKVPEFVQGLRRTDAETMEIAEMVLSGKVNKCLVGLVQKLGVKAVGISGKDGGLLKVDKKTVNGEDIGFVGNIKEVDSTILNVLLENGIIPIVAPLGLDDEFQTYNINADDAACSIASALHAEKLVFLTDVEGVLLDPKDKNTLISEITTKKAEELILNGNIGGGMLPKMKNCIEAVEKNVGSVHILDGRIEHSILLEVFTKEGIGTVIVK
ncbi:MAG: argB [Clostridiales bacterium]|jgi:acetylglutamate kinase|nr:argB [Clostridiales bacterium]